MYPYPTYPESDFPERGGIFSHKKWLPLERSGEALQGQNSDTCSKGFRRWGSIKPSARRLYYFFRWKSKPRNRNVPQRMTTAQAP